MRYFDRARLDRAFDARSVAIIGAKQANGYFWLTMFEKFAGALSSVHVNPDSIRDITAMGIANYGSIGEVPGPVDYVVVNTPRRVAVDTFEQCIAAGVGAVSFFTAGFAETDDEGRALQQSLAQLSRDSGVPIFGPNCTGIYNPARHMSSMTHMPLGESGPVGMVSQSGTHAGFFAKALSSWYGLHEARGISFGNGAVLDAADWLEYIGEDDRVRVVAAYLEGIGERAAGDYDRFETVLARVTAKKPVVIWKGGNTIDGARAASNHTGALPVDAADWASILRRTGAIGVDSMEALVDVTASLVRLPPPRGPRVGLVILTGGQGIAITDTMVRHGLCVPPLTSNTLAELATFFDPIGGSYRNPLDAAYATETPAMLAREFDLLAGDPNIDVLAMDLFGTIMSTRRIQSDFGVGRGHVAHIESSGGQRFIDVMAVRARDPHVPFVVIVTAAEKEREAIELRELLRDAGVLAFPSAERAAYALRTYIEYLDRRQ